MNSTYHNASTEFQNGSPIPSNYSCQSVKDHSSDRYPGLVCLKPGCEDLKFESEVHHRNHILTHITLPQVIVSRLKLNNSQKKRLKYLTKAQKSLKVRLKLTSQAGSNRPAFEDILANRQERQSNNNIDHRNLFSEYVSSGIHSFEVVKNYSQILSEPAGVFNLNGLKEDKLDNIFSNQEQRSSARGPDTRIELDNSLVSVPLDERGDGIHANHQEQEDRYRDEDNLENVFEEEEEEDEEEEDENENEGEEQEQEQEDRGDENSVNDVAPPSLPNSPTSDALRPQEFLAPDQLVDDDLCYTRSPTESQSRMVEMNGSTSAVSGSDNDSGHSRSPVGFSGSGSGGEEDSSTQQPFNWDELVEASTGHQRNESVISNDNSQTIGNGGDANDATSDLGSDSVAGTMLEGDPLLLPETAPSAEGEQDNLNLLQNLTSDPLHPEVDRGAGGETEYMSLDRLAEVCEVCGERAVDRRGLEEHRALAGHYKCLMLPECGSIVWASAAELAAHQASIHGQSRASPHSTSPRTSPQSAAGIQSPGPGTPPVQQLAQQVQRLPVPQQPPYMPGGQYPGPPQMGPMMSQMMPGPAQMPQRRPPVGYRMPGAGPPPHYGPGSPNQPPSFSGSIQPRPLNTLVARGPGPSRMPPGAVMPPRGMVPMPMRGHKRPGPVPQAGRAGASMPHNAKQRRVEGMMPPQPDNTAKKSDASAVANILATRGITVTPAGGVGRGSGPQSQPRQRQNVIPPLAPPAPAPAPVATLNLTSAISIIPTSGATNSRQQNNSGFAVPQVRSMGRQPVTNTNLERPPRPPTVDLTGDGPPPGSTRLQMGPSFHRGRGRPSNLSRTTCQICDKVFASPEMLNQHMVVHRGPGKLPFRCNLCNAQYPNNQGLQQHRQTYHKETLGMGAPLAPGEEMVIPLVDLKQPGVAARLSSLGIHHCIPLSGLGNQSNGFFSLPVVSIDGSRPGAAGNLRSLGATGVLSIGPIKIVPK